MATTDLRFISANFRGNLDENRRRTGEREMVLQCVTDKGRGRTVVFTDAAEVMRAIEQLSHMVNVQNDLARRRAEIPEETR